MGWVNFVTVWLTFWEEVLDDEAGGRAVIAEGVALSLRDRELRQPNQGGGTQARTFSPAASNLTPGGGTQARPFRLEPCSNPTMGWHAGNSLFVSSQQPNHGVARRQEPFRLQPAT